MESDLKELLRSIWVDDQGTVRWKIPPAQRTKVNDRVGTISKTNDEKEYLRTSFRSIKRIGVHRVAYMYFHPDVILTRKQVIDHKDQNTLNNSESNLRLTDTTGNAKNCKLHCKSSTGICGVSWSKTMNKYRAYVSDSTSGRSKQVTLGYFTDIELAANAAKTAREKLGYLSKHGTKL